MSLNNSLTDRCDIQRMTMTAEPIGSVPSFELVEARQPCLFIEEERGGINTLSGEFMTTIVAYLLLPHQIDIREGDRVTNVMLNRTERIENDHDQAITFNVSQKSATKRGRGSALVRVRLEATK